MKPMGKARAGRDQEFKVYSKPVLEKITYIIEAWGNGFRTPVIVEKFCNDFKMSKPSAYRYYKMAEKEIRQMVSKDREKHSAKAVNRMQAVYRKAMMSNDYMTAIAAARHHDQLLELTKTGDNVNVSIDAHNADSLRLQIKRQFDAIADPGAKGQVSGEPKP